MTTKKELLKIIRSMCLRCTCGSDLEIKQCTSNVQPFKEYITCPLYPFRMGKDPYRSKTKGFASRLNVHTSVAKSDFAEDLIEGKA